MANLSEDIQCAGSDTRPPMLDKTDFASWQQRIRLYCRGKENGDNAIDEKDVDEQPFGGGEGVGEGLALNVDIVYQADDYAICEHHEEHGMQDDVQPSYVVGSHVDYTSDSNTTPYDQYVKDNAVPVTKQCIRLLEHIICQDVMNIVMHADLVPVNVLPVDHKCLVDGNLESERLIQENDHLFELLLSQDIVHICVNSLATLTNYAKMEQDYIDKYGENLVLKAELAKKEQMVEKKFFDEVILRYEWQAKLDAKDVSIANLRKHIESLNGKNLVEKDATPNKTKVIALGMFKLDLEPLSPKVLKNKDAHIDYIKHTREDVDILWELVKHARAPRPLDSDLDSAYNYAKRIQEVLVYIIATCPSLTKPSEKLVVITQLKNKKVMFAKTATSLSNTQKQVDSHKTQDSNKPVLPSTGMKSSTSASRSQTSSNTKNNRISWKPTGRTFTIVGNMCPLTMITSTKVEPLKENTLKSITTPNPEIKIYRRKPKVATSVDLSSEPSYPMLFGYLIAKIMGYGDYQMGNVTISRVYYVEGLGHNLFSIGQFCDSDLEVAFRKHTCYIRDLKASKTKSWLWHRRLSHLNFDTITTLAKQGLVCRLPKLMFQKEHLCYVGALGKSKKHAHKPKADDYIQEKLYLLHIDLCGPIRIQNINGRKYILVIVNDYSRFTWVKFVRSKDEVPEFVIKFLKMIQVRLNATIQNIRTDNGIKFVNQTLRAYYEHVGISHQTSIARSPQQNGVVKRQNRTLVEAARTMLIFSKAPLFLWAEAVVTSFYTQKRSLIQKSHNKTPYELLHNRKLNLSYLHVFGALCYPTNDSENLGKLKPKADIGIFFGYAFAKKAYRIYNKRTCLIIETIYVDFDELIALASEQFS
ncbi:retrovirus-related pol polyprotein from transposon TNT 1-94 [Tanacetum coccineum]